VLGICHRETSTRPYDARRPSQLTLFYPSRSERTTDATIFGIALGLKLTSLAKKELVRFHYT
jgi:hypothetical protein